MDLNHIEIPRIEDEKVFERMVRDLYQNDERYSNVNLNGSRGQSQQGIDIFARTIDLNKWIGVQCKVKEKKSLTKKEIEKEIELAKKFNPAISHYYIYTTLKRNTRVQQLAREFSNKLNKGNFFDFDIVFWDDIVIMLKDQRNFHTYLKYYSKFFTDNTLIGNFIGKLFNLNLGFGSKLDSHYELMLGKIPNNGSEGYNVDYYRGAYFLVNLMNFRMEIIHSSKPDKPPHCYYNDLIDAIDNKIDTFRIVKWINSLKNLDKFIYEEKNTYEFYISKNEQEKFLKSWKKEE